MVVVDHPPVLLPPPADPVQSDALLEHPHPEALLEATRLAGLATPLVDLAVVGGGAGVLDVAWGIKVMFCYYRSPT